MRIAWKRIWNELVRLHREDDGVVNLTTVLRQGNLLVTDVEATLDADTTATIPHGMADAAIKEVTLLPLLQVVAGLSLWAVTLQDAVNITCTKSVAVGSGNAGAQLRVFIEKIGG